jgi:hypothetical protein
MDTMEVARHFDLPDDVRDWDDVLYFNYLQDHQFAYQAILDDMKARGLEGTEEYRHWMKQFRAVEGYLARDFNRRYQQG